MLCRQSAYNYKELDVINSTLRGKTCEDKKKDFVSTRVFHAQNRLASLFEEEVKLASAFVVKEKARSSRNEREVSDDTNEKWSRERLTKRVCQCSFFSGSLDRPIFQIGSEASVSEAPDSQSVGRRSMN